MRGTLFILIIAIESSIGLTCLAYSFFEISLRTGCALIGGVFFFAWLSTVLFGPRLDSEFSYLHKK